MKKFIILCVLFFATFTSCTKEKFIDVVDGSYFGTLKLNGVDKTGEFKVTVLTYSATSAVVEIYNVNVIEGLSNLVIPAVNVIDVIDGYRLTYNGEVVPGTSSSMTGFSDGTTVQINFAMTGTDIKFTVTKKAVN